MKHTALTHRSYFLLCGSIVVDQTNLMGDKCRISHKPFLDQAAEARGQCGCLGSDDAVETIRHNVTDT